MLKIHLSEIRENYEVGIIQGGYSLTVFIDNVWFATLTFQHDGWNSIRHVALDAKLTWYGTLWSIIDDASTWQTDVFYIPDFLDTPEKLVKALRKAKSPSDNNYSRRIAKSGNYRSGSYPSTMRVVLVSSMVSAFLLSPTVDAYSESSMVDVYVFTVFIGERWLAQAEVVRESEILTLIRFSSRLNWYSFLEVLWGSINAWDSKVRSVRERQKLVKALSQMKPPRNNHFVKQFNLYIKRKMG
jgi:hypothetical protein